MCKELLIMIPAYNEGESIKSVLNHLIEQDVRLYADVIIIDDGSKDNTKSIAESCGFSVLSGVINLGYGSAIQLGYKYAKGHNYEYVIQLDADGQHDVLNVQKIYECLRGETDKSGEKPDIVIGSRFLSDDTTFKTSKLKLLAINFFRIIIKVFTKQKITDPTSGLQGLNRKTFNYYAEYNNFDNKYPDINMIIQMLMQGFKIVEIPVIMHERTTGESMHNGIFKQLKYMIIITLSTISVILRNRKA